MAEEITRGKEPITVRITPSLAIFIVSGVAAISGVVVSLTRFGSQAADNSVRIERNEGRIVDMERRLQLLEWQVAHPPVARSSSVQTEQSLQALTDTPHP